MKVKVWLILLGGLLLLPCVGSGQDLVFKFINPAFGGDTFNYQWLLSSAEAQNTFEEESSSLMSDYTNDPLADFESSLNRQILSQLSRKLIDSQFGEDELGPGTYVFGNYQIEIGEQDGGLNVVIFDLSNGGQSTIFIPYY